jgi:hypothetical protein
LSPVADVFALIAAARRRFVLNEALSQIVLAACAVICGAIVILILGTQLLDWQWLALLLAGGLGLAGYRIVQRRPSSYRVAQVVDRRLSLDDSLSTALYFAEDNARPVSSAFREMQRQMAEEVARGLDPALAVPLSVPRHLYLLFGLLLAASGLFALRYGIERNFAVRAPLTQVLFDVFGGARYERRAAAGKKREINFPYQTALPDMPTVEEHPEEGGQYEQAPEGALDNIDVPEVNNDKAVNPTAKKSGEGKDDSDSGEETKGDEGDQKDADQQGGAKQGNQGKDKQGQQAAASQSNDSGNSSLASKLKDAMSSLFSKMRPQQDGSKQTSQDGQQSSSNSKQKQGDQAVSMPQPQSGENAGDQTADGKLPESAEKMSGDGGGTGMGKTDGDKAVHLAEQLEAMGKISEIIGKRSQNVTGDMTIEVQSTKQQLKTPYASSKASHAQAGGEINRDEVPAASQEYVQQYFEQIRKQSAPSKAPPPSTEPISKSSAPAGSLSAPDEPAPVGP